MTRTRNAVSRPTKDKEAASRVGKRAARAGSVMREKKTRRVMHGRHRPCDALGAKNKCETCSWNPEAPADHEEGEGESHVGKSKGTVVRLAACDGLLSKVEQWRRQLPADEETRVVLLKRLQRMRVEEKRCGCMRQKQWRWEVGKWGVTYGKNGFVREKRLHAPRRRRPCWRLRRRRDPRRRSRRRCSVRGVHALSSQTSGRTPVRHPVAGTLAERANR